MGAKSDVDYPRVHTMRHAALDDGAFWTPSGDLVWHIASQCEDPPMVELFGRDYGPRGENRAAALTLAVRCRKCLPCRQLRSYEWIRRAACETLVHPRTYFGTLTLRPEVHYEVLAGTVKRLAERAVSYDKLSPPEQFAELVATAGSRVTRYIKRVRAELATPLRYILVAEKHKSGLPHFHALVHEVIRATDDAFDTYDVLKRQWTDGFSDWSGVDRGSTSGAWYVCKYLVKANEQRVRCSFGYGRLLDVPGGTRTENRG